MIELTKFFSLLDLLHICAHSVLLIYFYFHVTWETYILIIMCELTSRFAHRKKHWLNNLLKRKSKGTENTDHSFTLSPVIIWDVNGVNGG